MYLTTIEHIFSNQNVLPHLNLLDWEDTTSLQPCFFDAVSKSSVQHFKVFLASLDRTTIINPPSHQISGLWPLRTLYLNVFPQWSSLQLDVSTSFDSFFRLCSTTLESLTWCYYNTGRPLISTDQFGPTPVFPALRHLRLAGIHFADTSILDELVHDKLVSLDVDTRLAQDFFNRRGPIPGLRTFLWSAFPLPLKYTVSLTFLQSNSHISKLKFSFPTPASLLNYRILPLLAKSFTHLKSLSLRWDYKEDDISALALDLISRLSTLEQLHLSPGCSYDDYHYWLIDHDKMRRHLSKLPSLKKLALSHDSYSNGIFRTCERYYIDGWSKPEDQGLENNHAQFEEDHRKRMQQEAARYAEVIPSLEWLYIGQIPMAFRRGQHLEKSEEMVEPLTSERIRYTKYLIEIFGWKGLLVGG
ncbi:MAG: hypothetical protein Q9223_002010 [Gallowayella weberi]